MQVGLAFDRPNTGPSQIGQSGVINGNQVGGVRQGATRGLVRCRAEAKASEWVFAFG